MSLALLKLQTNRYCNQNCLLSEAYGGTEQGLSHFGRDGDYRTKSVGKPLDLTEMKVQLWGSPRRKEVFSFVPWNKSTCFLLLLFFFFFFHSIFFFICWKPFDSVCPLAIKINVLTYSLVYPIFEPPHDKTNKMTVRPAKTQISLLSAWRKLGSLAIHWAHSEDSDQTGRMPRLIWVFAGRTCHFVGFVMKRLISLIL